MEKTVMTFGIVPDIAGEGGETVTGVGLADGRPELHVVGPGTSINDRRQGQVRTHVNHLSKLGIPVKSSSAAMAEVGRDVTGFQAGGVHRRQFMVAVEETLLATEVYRGVEQGGEVLFLSRRSSA